MILPSTQHLSLFLLSSSGSSLGRQHDAHPSGCQDEMATSAITAILAVAMLISGYRRTIDDELAVGSSKYQGL